MGHYNRFAGANLGRLEALSDGLFAVAMTLLVFDLHAPAAAAIARAGGLTGALVTLLPRLLVYLMSFLTLGIFWVGQQTGLNFLAATDRNLTWLHLGFLFAVSLMPFSTALMAGFIAYRAALLVYWCNIFLLGALLFAALRYAAGAGLVRADAPEGAHRAVERRIVIAQALYGVGAALCLFSTYASIGFIILVQLNYVIAPRVWGLDRL